MLVYTYFDSDKSKQNASTYFICNCGHLIVVSPFVCLIWGSGSESTTNGNLASKSCASTWTSDLLRRWLPKPRTTLQIGHEGYNLNHQNTSDMERNWIMLFIILKVFIDLLLKKCYFLVKFVSSKKTAKIHEIFNVDLTLTT